MRIRYSLQAGGWNKQSGETVSGRIPLEWRQEWFANLCLGVVLAVLIFMMMLAIFLVMTKPAPVSVPEGNGGRADSAAYAIFNPETIPECIFTPIPENSNLLPGEAV